MKKGLVFFLGMITGAFLCIAIFAVIGALKQNDIGSSVNPDAGITIFEKVGDELPYKEFQVLQVLPNGNVLMNTKERPQSSLFTGPTVLVLAENGDAFYDEQIIKVSSKQQVRQVGTYRYISKADIVKTDSSFQGVKPSL